MSVTIRVRIRPKRLEDARNDYQWSTDPELSDLDAVAPLTISFEAFLKEYRDQLRFPSPARRTFAVETLDGVHIGNCVYYNIDERGRQAEVGIMIGSREYWDKGYGTEAMCALVDQMFTRHNFKRLYLKTLEKNLRAQKSFQKCGFTPYGHMNREGYRFLLMELTRTRWQEKKGQAPVRRRFFRLPTL